MYPPDSGMLGNMGVGEIWRFSNLQVAEGGGGYHQAKSGLSEIAVHPSEASFVQELKQQVVSTQRARIDVTHLLLQAQNSTRPMI